MSGSADLYASILGRLRDPATADLVRRALAQGVVLDTWMNGQREESFSETAVDILTRAAEQFTGEALQQQRAVLPWHPMPEAYLRSAMYEILSGTALYEAQRRQGRRHVSREIALEAVRLLREYSRTESDGLGAAAVYYFLLSAHEDLNAIHHFKRMRREDFLLGSLHRPWSDMLLTNQLELYRLAGLVRSVFSGEGEVLDLTDRGEEVLGLLQGLLEAAGEFAWRADAQRWVIFNETDYDSIYQSVFPDINQRTREYLENLDLPPGARVLEVGAGTGRATIDVGLADLVGPEGQIAALDPSANLLQVLEAKRTRRGLRNIQVVQGAAERLPFPDHTFDATVAVISLHFTDAPRAIAEMVRVTKPGGLVSALVPGNIDGREIPVVAHWFRPLVLLAQRAGVSFSERTGLPPEVLQNGFRNSRLDDLRFGEMPVTASAENPEDFLAFVLKGAALFQHTLSRIPFCERWAIIRQIQQGGAQIAASASPEEKRHVYFFRTASGRVPATGVGQQA